MPGWVDGAGPARDGDPAAGDGRGGEEDGGVGEVGLDGPVARPDRARRDPPGVGLGVVDVDPGLAEHGDGHLDVRERRHRLAVVVHGDALVVARAGQQQPGHELGRRRRVDHDVAAGQAAGAVQGERKGVAVDPGAERAQGVEHGGHRAFAGALVAVERDGPVGEGGGGRDEPHDGAREPAVDGAAAAQAVVGADRDALAVGLDRHAQRAQGTDHQRGVARSGRPADGRGAAGEGGEQQRAVGDGLRARHGDHTVHGALGKRGGPGHPAMIPHAVSRRDRAPAT